MQRNYFCLVCLLFLSIVVRSQQTVGVFLNDSLSYNGYTLLFPSSYEETYLIDNCGFIVNQWTSTLRPGLSAYLLEDGDLLRTARITSDFNSGGSAGRVERFSWEGALKWTYTYSNTMVHSHHDVELLPNGNILMIAWESVTDTEAISLGRNPTTVGTSLWPDHIIEVEPIGTDTGNIVWEWHSWDHLIQDFDNTKPNFGVISDHPEKINLNYIEGSASGQDWHHLNGINYNEEFDQIIVSSRHWDEFWVIDHSTTTAEAAGSIGGNSGKGGDLLYRWGNPSTYNRGTPVSQQLFGQHDAQWIEEGLPGEGNIIVYNNGIGRPGDDFSQIIELEPPVDASGNYSITSTDPFGPLVSSWIYQDPVSPTSFYSTNISGVQRLPNGNTLICEGASGHLFEVDDDGKTHWDYVSPVNFGGIISQGDNAAGNTVFRAYRYGSDYPAFDDKDLIPTDPVEANPIPLDCEIYLPPVSGINNYLAENIRLFPNPASEFIWIQNKQFIPLEVHLLNSAGILNNVVRSSNSLIQIDINDLPSGLYFIKINSNDLNLKSKNLHSKTWKILIP
ncbi:MAG: hypothetical protein ACI959_000876 [Limisphaerales bacterium]|jgi:hypothetical protein